MPAVALHLKLFFVVHLARRFLLTGFLVAQAAVARAVRSRPIERVEQKVRNDVSIHTLQVCSSLIFNILIIEVRLESFRVHLM